MSALLLLLPSVLALPLLAALVYVVARRMRYHALYRAQLRRLRSSLSGGSLQLTSGHCDLVLLQEDLESLLREAAGIGAIEVEQHTIEAHIAAALAGTRAMRLERCVLRSGAVEALCATPTKLVFLGMERCGLCWDACCKMIQYARCSESVRHLCLVDNPGVVSPQADWAVLAGADMDLAVLELHALIDLAAVQAERRRLSFKESHGTLCCLEAKFIGDLVLRRCRSRPATDPILELHLGDLRLTPVSLRVLVDIVVPEASLHVIHCGATTLDSSILIWLADRVAHTTLVGLQSLCIDPCPSAQHLVKALHANLAMAASCIDFKGVSWTCTLKPMSDGLQMKRHGGFFSWGKSILLPYVVIAGITLESDSFTWGVQLRYDSSLNTAFRRIVFDTETAVRFLRILHRSMRDSGIASVQNHMSSIWKESLSHLDAMPSVHAWTCSHELLERRCRPNHAEPSLHEDARDSLDESFASLSQKLHHIDLIRSELRFCAGAAAQ